MVELVGLPDTTRCVVQSLLKVGRAEVKEKYAAAEVRGDRNRIAGRSLTRLPLENPSNNA
ncbi:hypothetical protein OG462_04945 [Streptomyces sp. NBC_01077]|uniref:hypothetical protein n=1 Tax=Streptomyces sp. NBC_01077 TaxID=2903746 RepID=UPI0038702D20|nr:hypothetical protein OG462_04945 [Streptomyces sp. NBC_01077]